jgi:predicted amidohydrolase
MSQADSVAAPATYTALALQISTICVNACNGRDEARGVMRDSLTRLRGHVGGSTAFIRQFSGLPVKLVVLPEYFLTGFPMRESVAEWRDKAALEIGGEEYESLGSIAQAFDLYLAGNAYECDPHFPDLYFQTCFVVGPSGDVVLRYRRLISLSAPTPYDVWDQYLDHYGLEAVFPVADTEIGRLAGIASEEILYPEIARCHLMRGAEIFVHPTSESGSPAATGKEIARQARAVENMAYVVSTNSASLENLSFPAHSTTAMSKVVDYTGKILAEATAGESMVANAPIDIGALRAARRRTGLTNMVSRQPFQVYAESYAQTRFRPSNLLLDGDHVRIPERAGFSAMQQADIDRLSSEGKI